MRLHHLALFVLACVVAAPASGQLFGEDSPFRLGLFADAGYTTADEHGDGAFTVGSVDIYATASLSDRWSGLVELVFEDVGEGLITDLERVEITYDHSAAFRLTIGRMHSPVIRWNQQNHHGAFVQTTIDRPAIAAWEDEPGLWPVHLVGGLATGENYASGLTWGVGFGNGRGPTLDEIQTTSNIDDAYATLVYLGWGPVSVPGAKLYATYYKDRIPTEEPMKEQDLTISAEYLSGPNELRAEWARMEHTSVDTGQRHESTGWYVLYSRALPGRFDSVRPYVLVDRLSPAADEPYLENAVESESVAVGARWDVARSIALKADYRSERLDGGPHENAIRFQLAISLN